MNTAVEQSNNLLNYSQQQLRELFSHWGEKPFHGTQLFRWMHYEGVSDFAQMTNLSKSLRQRLVEQATIAPPETVLSKKSQDGTHKWLLRLTDGNCIETVFIPDAGRGTLCVSSQVGCALNCSFCSTARQGFNRNLTVAEIIGQVWVAARELSREQGKHDHHVTNVVMMGMGEPMLNFDNVVTAMNIMMDDQAYGLSKYRVTLSTSGVVPAMYQLAKVRDVALAVSLHAPNDELRNELVPLNKKYPLSELLQACREYFPKDSRRKITMEYVMLAGVNDTPKHAKQLINILQGVPVKVNLIPFNPFPHAPYERSSAETIDAFQKQLIQAGITTITRRTRGEDIDAACGQLAGEVNDRTRRSERLRRAIKIKVEEEAA